METTPKPQRVVLWGDCFIGKGGFKGIADLFAVAEPAQAAFKQLCVLRGRLNTAALSCGVNLFFTQRQILAFKRCVLNF